jgi:hypothetical protein
MAGLVPAIHDLKGRPEGRLLVIAVCGNVLIKRARANEKQYLELFFCPRGKRKMLT